MADNRYIITRSNYTIKSTHKQLSSDTIYERDFMTTSNFGSYDSGAIPWGESNFKFIYSDDFSEKRKHKYGEWVKSTSCGGDDDFWDLRCTGSGNTSSESRIIRNPNYTTFRDFVYYGNCTKLIKSSIEEVIKKYPGELYITEQPFTYINSTGGTSYLGGMNFRLISNPFKIDISSPTIPSGALNYRYFCSSWNDYRIIDAYGVSHEVTKWETFVRKKTCFNNGNVVANINIYYKINGAEKKLEITQYYYNGEKILLIDKAYNNFHIRIKDDVLDTIFSGLDNFSNFLLNRESNPIYSINIEHPYDTESGVRYVMEHLTWPTEYGWNLSINGSDYSKYINTLLDISEWYDENRTDNIWRCMTHDPIKNMDKTFVNTKTNEDNTDFKIGTSDMQSLLQIYGKFFDNIKFDIDNIKCANVVTYDSKNNTPDYFLTDILNNSGWEICSVVPGFDNTVRTDSLFIGDTKKYSPNDANVIFLKNLAINSKAINIRKGTKEGIEMLLSLFGLTSSEWTRRRYNSLPESEKFKDGNRTIQWENLDEPIKRRYYDYTIDEEVAVATNTYSDIVPYTAKTDSEIFNSYKTSQNTEMNTGDLYGLPARMVVFVTNDGKTYKYLIPWFDKNDILDGKPYFQMYGGWDKLSEKIITPDKELYPNITKIESTTAFTVYNESVKYLKTAKNVGGLSNLDFNNLNSGDIFYVDDLSDINKYYTDVIQSQVTNYFIIENKDNFKIYGDGGWKNIKKAEFKDPKHISFVAENTATFGEFINDREIISEFEKAGGRIGDWTYCLSDDRKPNVKITCISTGETPYFRYWKISDGTGLTKEATKVIYLNSIIDDSNGNKPHVGYGNYDDGDAYFNIFKQLFIGTIKDDLFGDKAYDCTTGELNEAIFNCGFKLNEHVIDNMKCWYFTDNSKVSDLYTLQKRYVTVIDENLDTYDISSGYEVMTTKVSKTDAYGKTIYIDVPYVDKVNVGKQSYINNESNFTSNLSAFDFETQENNSNDESAANSIINSKVVKLHFNENKYYENREFYKYFENAILPYLTQMIPSTTIISTEYFQMATATFLNGDGSILCTSTVVVSKTPNSGSTIPTKESTQGSKYTFKGWSPEIKPIYKDTIFVPLFVTGDLYIITFKNNGGTTLKTQYYESGDTPYYDGTPVAENQQTGYTYTFTGWTDDVAYWGKNQSLPKVTGNATYMAVYDAQRNTYTIKFNNYNGINLSTVSVKYNEIPVYSGVDPTKPSTEEKTYAFSGWTDGVTYWSKNQSLPKVTEDKTYTAFFEENTRNYTIKFKNDGSTLLSTQYYEYGAIPSYSGAEPKSEKLTPKENYELFGWKNNDASWPKGRNLPNVIANTEYIAYYNPKPVLSLYDAYPITLTCIDTNNNNIYLEETNTEPFNFYWPSPTPVKEGHNLTGWYTEIDGKGEKFDTGTTITGSCTVYSYYEPKICAVTFDGNGGKFDDKHKTNVIKVKYGERLTGKIVLPTKEGVSFNKWLYNGDEWDTASTIYKNMKIIATYNEISYKLTMDSLMDGSINKVFDIPVNQKIEEDYLNNLYKPNFDGRDFIWWYLDEYTLRTPLPIGSTLTKDTNVYAKYKLKEYKVTFEWNDEWDEGVSHGVYTSVTFYYGERIEHTFNDPTKKVSEEKEEYYATFSGWCYDTEGTKPFNFNTILYTDITLYAKWVVTAKFLRTNEEAILYKQFDFVPSLNKINRVDRNNLPDPESYTKGRIVYRFVKWYIFNGSAQVDFNFNMAITRNINIFGLWEEDKKPEQSYIAQFVYVGMSISSSAWKEATSSGKKELIHKAMGTISSKAQGGTEKQITIPDKNNCNKYFEKHELIGWTTKPCEWDYTYGGIWPSDNGTPWTLDGFIKADNVSKITINGDITYYAIYQEN